MGYLPTDLTRQEEADIRNWMKKKARQIERRRKLISYFGIAFVMIFGIRYYGDTDWRTTVYEATQPAVDILHQHKYELPPKLKSIRDSWAPKLVSCQPGAACVNPPPASPANVDAVPVVTVPAIPPSAPIDGGLTTPVVTTPPAPSKTHPKHHKKAPKKAKKGTHRKQTKPVPPKAVTGDSIIAAGTRWIGAPYSWGGGSGTGPTFGSAPRSVHTLGFDCSGLTYYVLRQVGVYPKTKKRNNAYMQFMDPLGVPVPANNLRAGDLIFFGWIQKSGGRTIYHVEHVGIYDGAGKVINAPHTGTVIQLTPITAFKSSHEHYVGARRFTAPGLRPRR